jgi:SAM-dependent methyltransferase
VDIWSRWLLTRRDPGDLPDLSAFRDGVLGRADLGAGDVLLDVGCGTGLIGFGALERLGPTGRVIFCDISADLLEECRRTAADDARCSFVQAAADDLYEIPDASVDVVTTRSVLIYCDRKPAAFAEFHRVLRPGGRLSIFEPINRFAHDQHRDRVFGLDGSPVDDLLVKVRAQFPATEAMVDFDERDLLAWASDAGFSAIELDYRARLDVPAAPLPDWDALLKTAPNPLTPTYGEAIAAALTASEQARLEAYAKSLVEARTPTRRTIATAFLRALRP